MAAAGVALMTEQWSSRARAKVSEWQEQAYGGLAEDLGWGWNPQRAFDKFSTRQVPEGDYRISIDRLRENYGPDYGRDLDWKKVEEDWDKYMKTYYHIEPPTKYENASIYSNAFANLTAITVLIEQVMPGYLTKTPRIASLPTGDLNAKSQNIRGTNEVAILLQTGLTGFIYHFSNIVACATPVDLIKRREPVPSAAKWGNPGDAKHVTYAAQYFTRLIDAYVVRGDPYLLPDPDLRGRAFYNQGIIGTSMRQFLVCHELVHVVYKHLDSKASSRGESWSREFLADEIGSGMVGGLRRDYDGPEAINTGIWACNVALAGFQILDECVAFLDTGSRVVPANDTHPPPRQRREHILEFQRQVMTRSGMHRDARSLFELFNKGEKVLGELSNLIGPHIERLQRDGVKPSPIWRVRTVPDS